MSVHQDCLIALNAADRCAREEQFEDAYRHVQAALEIEPHNLRARAIWGECLLERGLTMAAIEALTEVAMYDWVAMADLALSRMSVSRDIRHDDLADLDLALRRWAYHQTPSSRPFKDWLKRFEILERRLIACGYFDELEDLKAFVRFYRPEFMPTYP